MLSVLIKTSDLSPDLELYPHQVSAAEKFFRNGFKLVQAHGTGTGKCLRGDTPVLTNAGWLPIASLFSEADLAQDEEWSVPPAELRVLTQDGEDFRWVRPRALFRQRLSETESTVVVRTKRGVSLEVTRAHPLPIVRDLQFRWVPAGEVRARDTLLVPKQLPELDDRGQVPEVSDALVELLAWQVAEGYENDGVCITQKDTTVLCRLKELYESLGFGVAAIREYAPRPAYVQWQSKAYRELLEGMGYTWGRKSRDKSFPAYFVGLPQEQLRTLLSCFFEAEGHAQARGCIELSSASEKLLDQVVVMLRRFGIGGVVSSKRACATNGTGIYRTYWRLTLYGDDLRAFVSEIGFLSERKRAASEEAAAPKTTTYTTYGASVGDAVRELRAIGLQYAMRGICTARARYVGAEVLREISARLLNPPQYADDYRKGVVAQHRARTVAAVESLADAAPEFAEHLRFLADGPLSFDVVASVQNGASGGVVYDLEVPDTHNFVAGRGCALVHNTVGAIAAFEAAKRAGSLNHAVVVTPSGLRENFVDSIKQFTKLPSVQTISAKNEVNEDEGRVYLDGVRPDKDYTVVSYSMFLKDPRGIMARAGADTLIYDEFHRADSEKSKTFLAAMAVRPQVRGFIGLTGSILNNEPSDIVPLLRIATNDKLPVRTRAEFDRVFSPKVGKEEGFFGGVKDRRGLRNLGAAKRMFAQHLDFLETEDIPGKSLPRKELDVVKVDMSPEQKQYYQYAMGDLPWATRFKIRHNVPMDRREVGGIFRKIVGARQVSNSLHTMNKNVTLEESALRTPKVRRALDDVQEHLAETEDGQAVLYSNLVRGGIDVMAAGLRARGIPFGVFMGKGREVVGVKSTEDSRNLAVTNYRAGKNKVLLISGAGAEGLSLPNTTFVGTLDGHFNPERVRQAEARGIRIGGQAHRAPENRKVLTRRYISAVPRNWYQKLFRMDPERGADEWVYDVAGNKAALNKAFRKVFENPESDDDLHSFAESAGLRMRAYGGSVPKAAGSVPVPRPEIGPVPQIEAVPAQQPPAIEDPKYLYTYKDPLTGELRYIYPEDKQPGSAGPSLWQTDRYGLRLNAGRVVGQ